MAFVSSEIEVIVSLLRSFSPRKGVRTVLSLGYPDLLAPRAHLERFIGSNALDRVGRREDSTDVAENHRRPNLLSWVAESTSFFQALGADLRVWDLHSRHPADTDIVDLNKPYKSPVRYDLVLDPGTTEHIFNIAVAMTTIAMATAVGGYVVHATPLHHLNHGYYSFSPVFYRDFYEANGFEIVMLAQKIAQEPNSEHGLLLNFVPMEPERELELQGGICHGLFIARKIVEPKSLRIPVQREFLTL